LSVSRRGFSLVEVLIATAITVGVGMIVFQLFHQNERIFQDENSLMEMQQTARVVTSQISDDVRIAGQGVPPGLGEIVLPGSTSQRLNIRAGFSAIETVITTTLPIHATIGSSLTLKVESTSGFSSGKQIYVWNDDTWLRAAIDSVSGSAKTIRFTPSNGTASGIHFTAPPLMGLDEAIGIYRDAATNTIRRTTSSNTANASGPSWAPANELAANVISLTFLYFDAAGQPLTPSTPEIRAKVASIETRARVQDARNPKQIHSVSVRSVPRNLASLLSCARANSAC
jgi:prepilin-type N-terminal cleavage/methylation domain-containing protein